MYRLLVSLPKLDKYLTHKNFANFINFLYCLLLQSVVGPLGKNKPALEDDVAQLFLTKRAITSIKRESLVTVRVIELNYEIQSELVN